MLNTIRFVLILLLSVAVTSCYTLLRHTDVLVSYQDEGGNEEYTEDYDVFVDEDCRSCHQNFNVAYHFNPLLPAHLSTLNRWAAEPWWFDNKYVFLFGTGEDDEQSGSYDYRHVSPRGSGALSSPPPSQGYGLTRPGGGSSSSTVKSSDNGDSKPANDHGVKTDSNKTSQRKTKSGKRAIKKRN